jgi:hypothetical protein
MLLFLGLLGFSFPVLILGIVVGLSGWLVVSAWSSGSGGRWLAMKFLIGASVLGFGVLRAMWVTYPAPGGSRLKREDAPGLFEDCEEISAQLEGPRIDEVLVNAEMNAAIVQQPQLGLIGGLFGIYKNYLLLGLPYLETANRELMRATLAHEIGHFSRSHGQFGSWIYRCQLTWARLQEHFEYRKEEGNFLEKLVAGLNASFYNWLAPKFRELALDQVRRHEFEADRAATQVTGARTNALSLANDVFMIEQMNQFWRPFWREAKDRELPPKDTYQRLFAELRRPREREEISPVFERAVEFETSAEDTHPCFRDRLADTGFSWREHRELIESHIARGVPEPSAEYYFSPQVRQRLTSELNGNWLSEATLNWQTAHRNHQKLAALESREEASLSTEELASKAGLTAETEDVFAAEPIYRRVLERDPQHEHARFMVDLAAQFRGGTPSA